ncbi:Hypothetical protein, predicted transmembrane protein [Mycoplasmopsis agalactiae 14628]|uniref:Chromosome partition protein Smc n=1 Tax=Mycoplasmopsis agalactiae 14628 TaxID=1110504 RepID=I5D6D6_MYCAA|nr:hypothetical protein [Mycoplasmopsis agalactiae]EIN15245.1 Hypothetical protein, predicted transmembrane protein [Mycoplasmopsis agalactiae 14628]
MKRIRNRLLTFGSIAVLAVSPAFVAAATTKGRMPASAKLKGLLLQREQLHGSISKADEDIKNITVLVNDLETNLEKMEKDAEPKVSKIEKEITNVSNEAEKLSSELKEAEKKYESVNKQHKIYKDFIDFTNHKVNELNHERIEVDSENSLDINKAKQKFDEAEKSRNELSQKIEKTKKSITEKQNTIESLKKDKQTIFDKIESTKSEITKNKKSLKQNEEKMMKSKVELSGTNFEIRIEEERLNW